MNRDDFRRGFLARPELRADRLELRLVELRDGGVPGIQGGTGCEHTGFVIGSERGLHIGIRGGEDLPILLDQGLDLPAGRRQRPPPGLGILESFDPPPVGQRLPPHDPGTLRQHLSSFGAKPVGLLLQRFAATVRFLTAPPAGWRGFCDLSPESRAGSMFSAWRNGGRGRWIVVVWIRGVPDGRRFVFTERPPHRLRLVAGAFQESLLYGFNVDIWESDGRFRQQFRTGYLFLRDLSPSLTVGEIYVRIPVRGCTRPVHTMSAVRSRLCALPQHPGPKIYRVRCRVRPPANHLEDGGANTAFSDIGLIGIVIDPDDLPGFKSADGPADGAAVVGLAVLVQHLGRDLALAHIGQSGFIIGEAGDGLGHSFIDGR